MSSEHQHPIIQAPPKPPGYFFQFIGFARSFWRKHSSLRILFELSRERNHFLGVFVVFPLYPFVGFLLAQQLKSPFHARIDVRNIDLRSRRGC